MPGAPIKKATNLAIDGFPILAERTGLEPATPGVTGRYSNQLNYRSAAINHQKNGVPKGIRTPVLTVKG